MYIVPAYDQAASIRSFDEHVPIGTKVQHNGQWFKTWSHAGRFKGRVSVWLNDNGLPVPVNDLVIPGLTSVPIRQARERAP